ncbi:MAG: transcription termination/antitermination NusG family protein [Flavobacteriaceae bacterium]|nr:transcription termination/antitermination NusG family protein [Flavobacteriaceae bacterium]
MSDNSKNWFVVYTKPRNELKVLQRLSVLGLQVYVPTKIEVRQWSDRKKKILVPLLPSMVLVSLQENEVNKVFEAPGVIRYMFEYGKRAIVSNEEVLAMQHYLELSYSQKQQEVAIGDTLRVPLLEEEAILLSKKGKNCIAQLKKMGAIVSFQLN